MSYKRDWHIEHGRRTCSVCNIEKEYSEYYLRGNGSPHGTKCKSCVNLLNRKSSMSVEKRQHRLIRQRQYNANNHDKMKKYYDSYRCSVIGRCKSIYNSILKRSEKWGEPTDITEEYILNLLENQKCCSVTGLPFSYDKSESYVKNPYSPSIDRIDCTKGYTCDNVRLVIWQFNLMKGELPDAELLKICKEVVSHELLLVL